MLEFDHSHSSFSLSTLGRRLRSVPALLSLPLFIAGIVLCDRVAVSTWLVILLFALLLGAMLLVRRTAVKLVLAAGMLLFAGWTVAEFHTLRGGDEPPEDGRAEVTLHDRATQRLERHLRDSTAFATAEAMVVGSRDMLGRDTRDDYTYTGLTHLMAISGLHLGIVMLVVGFILLPVNLIFWGWHIRAALIVVVLWLFASVSGFSPSVVRSVIMLTVLQLSAASVLRYNTMNALAVVVIAMLAWSPDYLYDISFQLSVLAVMGIVLWGVPLLSILGRRQIPGMSIITTVVVSLTATLWSMPLVAHTFSQVCFVNVIISPIVFITAYVVVGFGIFALVLPEALALPFARVMEAAAMLQNDVVARGAEWGYGFMMGSLSAWEMVAIYALFALITLVGCSWEEKKMITLHINE